jgi:hypothetical protein
MMDVTFAIFDNPYNKQESRAELKRHSPLHLSYNIDLSSSTGNPSLSIVLTLAPTFRTIMTLHLLST